MISNNLALYFGSNSSNSLKFIRNLVKNMNNSKNLSTTFDKKEKNYGYTIGLYSFSGIYNNPKELSINPRKKYFIRYFINIFNNLTRQQYGNTYRSPLLPIKINDNNLIEAQDKKPFYVYLLSQEPKNEKIVVQIILVEASIDEVILQEKCLGWALLNLPFKEGNEKENEKKDGEIVLEISAIYRGTPRELIFKNDLIGYHDAIMNYYVFNYPNLQYIKFLLPNNIILGYNEPLPGLILRSLPQIPNLNEHLKTVDFLIAYIKNINIEINPNLEENIINFGNEYRFKKYNMEENQNNKVFIKERKIKCGVHNTWKFINSNGLQNSITLTKITKNKLESNGVLMVDRFFSDPLSCSAIIMELEYILTVPIVGIQKEENLSLVIGYHIYVPEKINLGNYYKEKLLMFTGPGPTIYGDKMWYSQNIEDRDIKISYIISQNANLAYTSSVENENGINNEQFQSSQKTFPIGNNQIGQSLENLEYISKLEKTINNLKNKLNMTEEDRKREQLKYRQHQILMENTKLNFDKPISKGKEDESSLKNIPQQEIHIRKEEITEYQEFISFKKNREIYEKRLEEQEEKLKNLEKPKITEYEPMIKNISARDKSTLISKGVLDLVIKDPGESYIDLALEKELCSHGLATIFNFQFLSFKPSKTYYKDLRNVPEKIQFFFDFFNEKKLHSDVCNIMRPESSDFSNYYHFNNPLVLKKENINVSSTLLNDSKNEIIIEVRYDPSMDNSIDFRDFVKYLLTRRLVIQIKDVQKGFNIGCIKIPLKDLVAQDKNIIQLTKEYIIYDDSFKSRGYLQLLITVSKFNTIRPYSYNRDMYKTINSKEGYNTLSRKKKVKVGKMDITKLMSQNKNLYNYTVTNLNDQNNNIKDNLNDTNFQNEMNLSHSKELRIEKDLEKKLRVLKYFSTKANMGNQNIMGNTNYSIGGNIQSKENRLNELRQKQKNEQNFLNTLKTCEQIRDFNRREVLSKVSQESHKNSYNISLILGQPIFFNYSVFNDSENEENFHIAIEKIKKDKNNNPISERYMNNERNKIVSVITIPKEWKIIVEKEKLIKPNNYNVISDDLYFRIKPGETIPLVIKLLSYIENKEEDKYSICIHKSNGEPLYFLNINVKRVFPIYDHVFHYYLPFDNRNQKIILVNPFKSSVSKTMEMLNNIYISDNSIQLALDNEKHDFSFDLVQDNRILYNKFVIFLYSDEARTNLYLTWKIEIEWRQAFEAKGSLGLKTPFSIYIKYDKDSSNVGNNMTLQLFTDNPNTIIFPQGNDIPFTIFPNTQKRTRFILYPKTKENNLALINCINVYTRELYKSWIIKYGIDFPKIDNTEKINFIIGSQNAFNFSYTNPIGKPIILNFYSGDENIMEVIDKISSFNADETKPIKLLIRDKGNIGKEEVLLFISDNNEELCQTILLIINYRDNNYIE